MPTQFDTDEIELRHRFQNLLDEQKSASLVAELYHENSKQHRCDITFFRRIEHFNNSKLGYQLVQRAAKQYACAHRVKLPEPVGCVQLSLLEAIEKRRSTRQFGGHPMSLDELASLVKFGNGVLGPVTGDAPPSRAIPSGGGLYPSELYVLPLEIDGLALGAYHYDIFAHELARFVESPAEPILGKACFLGKALATASAAFAISACFERQSVKYDERAYRFTLLECGHLAQNILLVATALGLAGLPVGGFTDDDINAYLGLDGRHEAVLYLILVGSRR